MKVCILYSPRSESAQRVEDYVNDFKKQNITRRVELVNVDTRDGSAMAMLYDIVSYPAVMALRDDGQLLRVWQGNDGFPLMNELAYYSQG